MVAALLPDLDTVDLEAMKTLLIDRHETCNSVLNSRTGEMERLVLLVEKVQRMLLGAKSEKAFRQIDHLEFQL